MNFKIKLTLIEEMLGTLPADKDIYAKYVASLAPDALTRQEEVEAHGVDHVVDKGMTVFARKDGQVCLWNYMFKGLCKDACGALGRVEGTRSSKLRAYKKVIDGLVFVFPRQIMVKLPENGKVGVCQRPLRAETAQGQRTAIAISETLPIGTTMEVTFMLVDPKALPLLKEWLDYGALRGLGQWRNSGKGAFTWEQINCSATEVPKFDFLPEEEKKTDKVAAS